MKKVYIVCWGCGACDDHDTVHTNIGVHGVYTSKDQAKVGLEEFKNYILAELNETVDPDCDMPELMDEIDLSIDGSVDEEYFEISYILGVEPTTEYVKIEEKELI